MRKKFLHTMLLGLSLVSLLVVCSRSAPTISYSFLQLIYFEEDSGFVPRLTFFVIAGDEDGPDDLAELRLYHDFEGLVWKFTPDTWIMITESGNTWLGSHSIVMDQGELFPTGQYRAVLYDKGYERTERTFGFDGPAQSRYPSPKLAIENGNYTIQSEYPVNSFLCYNSAGEYRSTVKINAKTGALSSIEIPSDILSVALWAQDSEYEVSAVTKQVAVR